MNKFVFGAALAGALALSGAASATVFLDPGSFGGNGVHSTPGLTGSLVTGLIGGTELVTVSTDSPDTLTTSGGGESKYEGPMDDMLVVFTNSHPAITFNVNTKSDATMTLIVDGGPTFIRSLTKNTNKFTLHGDAGEVFTSLAFTFDPNVTDVRQIRVLDTQPGGPGGGVPEPATWAMMLMGFGGMGAVLRRQRRAAVAFA